MSYVKQFTEALFKPSAEENEIFHNRELENILAG